MRQGILLPVSCWFYVRLVYTDLIPGINEIGSDITRSQSDLGPYL